MDYEENYLSRLSFETNMKFAAAGCLLRVNLFSSFWEPRSQHKFSQELMDPYLRLADVLMLWNVIGWYLNLGHDSVVVSAPDSQSGDTGFDPRQHPTCPRLTKPSILLRSVNWYQLRLGVKSPLYGHGVVSVGLLLAPFHSSFCSWSVSCKAGSGHFRCKSRYRKSGTFELWTFR